MPNLPVTRAPAAPDCCPDCLIRQCDTWLCDGCEEIQCQDIAPCENCCHCPDCCECATCSRSRCAARVASVCERCERCPECCGCSHCSASGCDDILGEDDIYHAEGDENIYCRACFRERYTHCSGCCEDVPVDDMRCSNCRQCNECCNCSGDNYDEDDEDDEDSPVIFTSRTLTYYPAKRGQCKRNPSRRLLSTEIEVASASYGDHVDSAARYWRCSIVKDGSLPNGGFEVCTSPAGGDQWTEQIEALCSALAEQDAQITSACGLHVHIDARDFSYWETRRLILLYARIESALYRTVPASRRESCYCKPCARDYLYWLCQNGYRGTRKAIARGVYGVENTRFHKRDKYDGARYRLLNLHSWLYRGTVECRLHTGTIRASKIVPWGMLWANILDTAFRLTERQIEALPGDPLACLLALCPNAETTDYVRSRIAQHGHGPLPAAVHTPVPAVNFDF